MNQQADLCNFTDLTGVIRPPEQERPRRLHDFFQGPDDLTIVEISKLMEAENFTHNVMAVGPSGGGKSSLLRIVGARRCCGEIKRCDTDPCGACDLCEAIFVGNPIRSAGYFEVSATDRNWRYLFDEHVAVGNGNVTVPGGNRRGLPPVVAIDEVHVLDYRQQTHIATSIQNSRACFMLASSEPDALIEPLVSRCLVLDLKPPSRRRFTKALGRLLTRRNIEFDQGVLDAFFVASKGNVRACIQQAHELSSNKLARWSERAVRAHLGLPLNTPLGWY